MQGACKGLKNLKETYDNDISTTSQIDIIYEKLQSRIQQIQKLLKIQVSEKALQGIV